MSKVLGIFFADSHMAPRSWPSRPIQGDSYFAFECLVDLAIHHQVNLIGAGDLIDKQENRSETIVRLYQQLDRLASHGLKLLYVQGQHELEQVPWLSGHPATEHVSSRFFELGGLNCYGLDYQPAGQLQLKLETVPVETDILIAHQVWAEFMGTVTTPQGSMADVPHASICFTGDLHEHRDVVVFGKTGQAITLFSPGSTCMQAIDEPPDKFCFLLTQSRDGIKFVPSQLPTRPFIDWHPINTEADMDAFVEKIRPRLDAVSAEAATRLPAHLCKPLLRVTYGSGVAELTSRVMPAVGDRAYVFFKETQADKVEEAEIVVPTNGAAVTLESALLGYLEARGFSSLESAALRLLQSHDINGELQRLRAEALEV